MSAVRNILTSGRFVTVDYLGEDTTDLLKDLGYDGDQIAKLVEDGVVAVED